MAKKSVGKRSLKRAVIYLRVSDPKQVRKGLDPEGISLPTQREACIRKAKELGVLIVDEYVEPGRTATAVAKRPRFREMMQRLRNERDVDHIIAYATSRMYRNWKENGAALLELQELGITLVSATENINSDTAEGELLEGVYAVLNGFRSRQDGEDVKRKMTHKAAQGGTVYRAPIGYLNKRDYSDGRDVRSIIIDPIRGPLIRLAFELFATGHYTYKSLQAKLTEAGLRTRPNGRYGERPISIYRLGTLLQDRYYLGYVTWDGVEYQGTHEPLINQELFDRVQRVLSADRRSGKRERTHNHYLKGLVWCDRCKRRLIVMPGKSHSGERYFYYLCRGRQDHQCDLPYLPVAKVEQAVRDHYATVRLAQDYRDRIKASIREAAASKRATGVQMRQRLQQRLEDLGHREDRYLDLYGEGNLPKDKLHERLTAIHNERDNLQRQLEQMQGELDTGRAILTSAVDLLDNPQAIYDEAKTPARRVLNKAIFTKLYLDDLDGVPQVAGDELTPPFSTVVCARRAESTAVTDSELRRTIQEALDQRDASPARPDRDPNANSGLHLETADELFLAGLLGRSLVGVGSSRTAMVPPAGFEPALPPPEGGALSPELRGPGTTELYQGNHTAPRNGQPRGVDHPSSPLNWPNGRSWGSDRRRHHVASCHPLTEELAHE